MSRENEKSIIPFSLSLVRVDLVVFVDGSF